MFTSAKDPQLPHKDIKAILEQAGITPTQQRLDIARVMLRCQQHLSAEQVMALVNETGNTVSKATVYNTLGLFVEKGIIREVIADPNRIVFDSNTDNHYHLYHEDTGTLTDINADCLLSNVLSRLPEGTTLVGVEVIIRVRNT